MKRSAEQVCAKKRTYGTRHDAKVGRRELQRRYGKRFHIYVCPVCGMWHLGSMRKKMKFMKHGRVEPVRETVEE